jgi:hypothetical protein
MDYGLWTKKRHKGTKVAAGFSLRKNAKKGTEDKSTKIVAVDVSPRLGFNFNLFIVFVLVGEKI